MSSESRSGGEDRPGKQEERGRSRWAGRRELLATLLLAMATVLTAWSAFQATKWSGTQAIHFARASALRTDSAKAAGRANAQQIVDVSTFVSWLSALADERRANPNASTGPDGSYQPDPTSLSGFLFARLRPEFQRVVEQWLAERPLQNPQAAPTPFALPSYQLAEQATANRLEGEADLQATLARRDNQRGDNYVLATVLFASVLFFAGVTDKLKATRSQMITLGLAVVVFIGGIAFLATFPVQV